MCDWEEQNLSIDKTVFIFLIEIQIFKDKLSMKKPKLATLEFQIKRGLVDDDSLDEDTRDIVEHCINLCKKKKYEDAVNSLLPELKFEWIWGNCDGDASDVFDVTEEIDFPCSPENSKIKLGESNGSLVITATVSFQIPIKNGVSESDIQSWLEDNSAYACGYVGAGWTYAESDGDNVSLVKLS